MVNQTIKEMKDILYKPILYGVYSIVLNLGEVKIYASRFTPHHPVNLPAIQWHQ